MSIPSGRTHDTINFVVLFFITLFLLSSVSTTQATSFAGGYLIGLFLFSPDLDTKSASYRRWGPLRYLWLPYVFLFKHRGISHNPIVGPLLRLLYVGAFVLGITVLLKARIPSIPLTSSLFFLLGYWVPSVVHYVVDKKR
ncbi:MAG: metal-binding protein [Candidatus Hydrothermarchaeales archaeon]